MRINKINVITFGCRLNAYESEVMRTIAQGIAPENTVIINTCAVTKEAERQASQAIRKIRKKNPDAFIIVTGCAAQLCPERFAQMPEVDRVLGNQEKLIKKNFSCLSTEKVNVAPGPINCLIPCAPLISFPGKAKAFLKIQNGCNHFCTFCATRLARGPSQSVPMKSVLKQARHFIENGIKEIILTGIDIASYGQTLAYSPTLADLIHDLLTKLPDLPRLRISSIDSIEIDEKLFELLISKHNIMPHLHLSLQSGDNTILSKMKRRHTREEAIEICMKLKQARPELVLVQILLLGFPERLKKCFKIHSNLVEECGYYFFTSFFLSSSSSWDTCSTNASTSTLFDKRTNAAI